MDKRTEGRTENLPILQDFVSYWGRCPKKERKKEIKKERKKRKERKRKKERKKEGKKEGGVLLKKD